MKAIAYSGLNPEIKRAVLEFLHDHPMAAIATINIDAHKPESALVAFAEFDTFELLFETLGTSRKSANLKRNNAVAFVVGEDPKHHVTLQYEGEALPIPRGQREICIQHFLQKDTPCTEGFLRDPRVELYKVRPKWIRYSDYTGETPDITEISF